jgi:5-deoxy-glucuronate isomerase
MSLLVHPDTTGTQIESFGFELLAIKIVKLQAGQSVEEDTAGRELAIVPLGGICSVSSSAGNFPSVGGRASVFSGLPHTLYLPIATRFTLTAQTDCDLAFCYSKAEEPHAAALVGPADVRVEIRGGGNATRQINHMIQPGFAAHRILVCEVYTPSGNWSSYPPHKHDVHNPPGEVDLEEFYYYRIDKPEGYAIQKVYSADRRIDETLTVRDGELVLVPEGYHPVVAAHGYNAYYLNVLAGSARSMAASDDPEYAWVRDTWREQDPRLPLVR